jgi:hypothetical protein
MVFSNWREIGNERIYIATEYSTVTAWLGMGMKVARDTRAKGGSQCRWCGAAKRALGLGCWLMWECREPANAKDRGAGSAL